MSPRPHNRKQKRARRRTTAGLTALAAGLAATNPANATLFNEGVTDLSDDMSMPTLLPDGTTQVTGDLDNPDNDDWFKISDLKPHTSYTASIVVSGEVGLALSIGGVTKSVDRNNSDSIMGTIPADGMLTIGAIEGGFGGITDYTLTLDAWRNNESAIPEPTTAALGALSIAALANATKRRRNDTPRKQVKNQK